MLIALIAGGVYMWQLGKTEQGRLVLDGLRLSIPYIGGLYKLYLSRISDNLSTMLLSGVSVIGHLKLRLRLWGMPLMRECCVKLAWT